MLWDSGGNITNTLRDNIECVSAISHISVVNVHTLMEPDQIRVDLLKVRRKMYLSYPENSQERKNFLLLSKLSELGYLSGIAPEKLANSMFEKYDIAMNRMGVQITLSLFFGIIFSWLFVITSFMFPNVLFLKFAWIIPAYLGLTFSLDPIYKVCRFYKAMKPFRDAYLKLKKRVNLLHEETQKLRGEDQ